MAAVHHKLPLALQLGQAARAHEVRRWHVHGGIPALLEQPIVGRLAHLLLPCD